MFFLSKGYRVVAHDRRGHGRSDPVADCPDIDHYEANAFAVAGARSLIDRDLTEGSRRTRR